MLYIYIYIGQLPELTASAIDNNIDIICIQEHRYLHSEDIKFNDTGSGCLSICMENSIEKIQPRMMVATFNGNPSAAIISCYSSTNVNKETKHA